MKLSYTIYVQHADLQAIAERAPYLCLFFFLHPQNTTVGFPRVPFPNCFPANQAICYFPSYFPNMRSWQFTFHAWLNYHQACTVQAVRTASGHLPIVHCHLLGSLSAAAAGAMLAAGRGFSSALLPVTPGLTPGHSDESGSTRRKMNR